MALSTYQVIKANRVVAVINAPSPQHAINYVARTEFHSEDDKVRAKLRATVIATKAVPMGLAHGRDAPKNENERPLGLSLQEAISLIEVRLSKFDGRTLKAMTDIYNVNPGDISSEQFGEFLSLKDLTKRFLWMKKGYTSKLKDQGDGFLSSSDGDHEFPDNLLAELSRARLITIK